MSPRRASRTGAGPYRTPCPPDAERESRILAFARAAAFALVAGLLGAACLLAVVRAELPRGKRACIVANASVPALAREEDLAAFCGVSKLFVRPLAEPARAARWQRRRYPAKMRCSEKSGALDCLPSSP